MAYLIPAFQNANLGWLYYKKYFDGDNEQRDVRRDENNRGKDTLANRNYTITQQVLSNSKQIFDVNAKHGFPLYTTYPGLLIGSGYTHEYGDGTDKNDAFKIGFFFDHVTGMPCVPGHGVKGALRAVFPNHKKEKYKEQKAKLIVAWLGGEVVCKAKFESFLEGKFDNVEYNDLLFAELLGELIFEGNTPVSFRNDKFEYVKLPLHEKDIFHDAFIIRGGKDNLFIASDYITPHNNPLKAPKPIQFLKILPCVGFQFQFDLKKNLISAEEKESLFKQILLDFGIGAKTNVGYGQFITVGDHNNLQQANDEAAKNKSTPKYTERAGFKSGNIKENKNWSRDHKEAKPDYNSFKKYEGRAKIQQVETSQPSDTWRDISTIKVKEGSIIAKILQIEGQNLIVQPYIKGLSDSHTIKITLGRFDDNPYKQEQEINIQLTQIKEQTPNYILQAKILKP